MKMIGIIFSDVYGSELEELTRSRTVASMPFGGRYRQIDFALSNMVNSDIFNIGVITNQNYRSLVDHLGSCQEWDLNRKKGGVHILPTAMSEKVAKEHSGKLDELRAALFFLKQETAEYVLLSDTNIIFNIDYRDVLESHVKSGCDITVVAKKTVENEKRPHEITLEVNENGDCRSISINYPAKKGMFKGMGSFIMSREKLVEIIEEYTARGNYSFKRDYIQRQFNLGELAVHVYSFSEVVLWNLNIADYFKNNLSLIDEELSNAIFRQDAPVYTRVHDEVPAYYGMDSEVSNCSIADGCIIEGKVEHSVLSRNVKICKGAVVKNAIIMQDSVVGENAILDNVIVDKSNTITPYTWLYSSADNPLIIQKGETI